MATDDLTTTKPDDAISDSSVSDSSVATTTPPDAPEAPTDDIMSNPEALHAYIQESIKKGVQNGILAALKSTPPKANTVDPTAQEKSEFEKLTYRERLQLYQSNPQAYYKLAKGRA